MNNRVILFHLEEAAEQLKATIEGLKTNQNFEKEAYQIEMSHLYHHLNTAWNGRDCTDQEHLAGANFDKWRKFPNNSELLL